MRLPSLDSYDVQGVRPSEAAAYGDDVADALDELYALELVELDV